MSTLPGYDDQMRGEPDPVLAALRAIVEQIEGASYVDQYGNPLELNTAFQEARELVRGYGGGWPPPHPG